LYSLAILLSTPLQLFPAIRILEYGTGLALRSGRQNEYIKWKKNLFRATFVIMTAGMSAWGANSLERVVALTGSLTW
jgi:solute carrier family 36 (proton-coupled amino acid transporter)